MFDCLKVCLNEKIQFGLVLQQIIRTDHLHLGVIELNLRQINICYIPSFTSALLTNMVVKNVGPNFCGTFSFSKWAEAK